MRGFWTPLDRAFTDVRVLHPQAPSNSNKNLYQMYRTHENEKKRKYNARVIQVEKASFTPLVFSTTGGMGSEADRFYKHLATKISNKTGQHYSDTVAFIRRRLRFDLLKTCIYNIFARIPRPTGCKACWHRLSGPKFTSTGSILKFIIFLLKCLFLWFNCDTCHVRCMTCFLNCTIILIYFRFDYSFGWSPENCIYN